MFKFHLCVVRVLIIGANSFPNVYGIDMPTRQELVAFDRSEDEVAEAIGADKVIFQVLPLSLLMLFAGHCANSQNVAEPRRPRNIRCQIQSLNQNIRRLSVQWLLCHWRRDPRVPLGLGAVPVRSQTE